MIKFIDESGSILKLESWQKVGRPGRRFPQTSCC